jgi:hypothetical protein
MNRFSYKKQCQACWWSCIFLIPGMNITKTILISISILLIIALPATAQSSASPFGVNFLEMRGQMYENAYAYHLEYKRQWYELLSTDVFVRRFPFSKFETGAGVTLRVLKVQAACICP